MAVVETLAKGVIELGIDDIKLKDEVRGGTRVIADGLKQALNSTRLTADHMQKLYAITKNIAYLDTSRVKLQDAVTRKTKEQIRDTKQVAAETQRYAQIRRQLGLDGGGASGVAGRLRDHNNSVGTVPGNHIMGSINSAVSGIASFGGAVGGAGIGLTFAAAAAAGSTTLDTLTGSLKMLSLAAGSKTQSTVMGISKAIQNLSKSVEKAEPGVIGGGLGALTGGAIGMRFGGPLGGLIGAGIGGLGGGLIEKGANDFADKRNMVAALKASPDKTIQKLLNEINDLEKPWYSGIPFIGNSVEIAKRRGAIRTAEAKLGGGDFKTAGLGVPGSFSGLADLRQQAQMAVFSPGGELGAANAAKELDNNVKAMQPVVNELQGLRQDLKGNGVMPPVNAN